MHGHRRVGTALRELLDRHDVRLHVQAKAAVLLRYSHRQQAVLPHVVSAFHGVSRGFVEARRARRKALTGQPCRLLDDLPLPL